MAVPHRKTSSTIIDIEWVFPLIKELVKTLSGLTNFELTEKDEQDIRSFLETHHNDKLEKYAAATNPIIKQSLAITLVQLSAQRVENSQHYRKSRKEQKEREFVDQCHINNIPLDLATSTQVATTDLQPSDCSALHDWPDQRLPANGVSGRLENAGQFIERLFQEKRYDDSVYGTLYMSDLKHINPRLYQSLAQWQSRTGNRLLKTKREEIDALVEQAETGSNLTFHQAAKVRNARWRRKRLDQQ